MQDQPIGTGTDVAIDAADVVLIKSDLNTVVNVINLSRKTIRNIKENLFWAFFYNVIGIPFAMGIVYLFGGPLLNPMLAGAAMSFSSVSVVLNALRLKRIKLKLIRKEGIIMKNTYNNRRCKMWWLCSYC